jgi:hypothetical protein
MQKYIYGFSNEKIDYTQEKGWQGNPHGCQEAESILHTYAAPIMCYSKEIWNQLGFTNTPAWQSVEQAIWVTFFIAVAWNIWLT